MLLWSFPNAKTKLNNSSVVETATDHSYKVFMHSFKYLLSAYYVQSIVLDAGSAVQYSMLWWSLSSKTLEDVLERQTLNNQLLY